MTVTFKIENGDVVLGANGSPRTVTGLEKTKQDLREVLSNDLQPNGFGAGLTRLVGRVVESPLIFSLEVQQRIAQAINRWIALQRTSQSLDRPAAERVESIALLRAAPQRGSLVNFAFHVTIRTASRAEVDQSGTVSTS
jgi:hypothetical protein